jgi:hypothetical protein
MRWAANLRGELSEINQKIATDTRLLHELTPGHVPSVIFGQEKERHGNFHPASYRNICANPDWARRLTKVHTASRKTSSATWRWKELDCANSSDALLMNIFCYRCRLESPALLSLLGVDCAVIPQFGFKPKIPLRNGKSDRTEIDVRLGNLLVEAKLTEAGFQSAPVRLIERYRDIDEIFNLDRVTRSADIVPGYQLIRGVLAAYATNGSFCLLCDARRPDLMEKWYAIAQAVRSCDLRCRLKILTWQELSAALSRSLRRFLAQKYGIFQ